MVGQRGVFKAYRDVRTAVGVDMLCLGGGIGSIYGGFLPMTPFGRCLGRETEYPLAGLPIKHAVRITHIKFGSRRKAALSIPAS